VGATLVRRTAATATTAAPSHAAGGAQQAASRARPRAVGVWLLTTAGMVFVMVVLGGVTRLTRSGLSIVEWRPTGEALPSTEAEWEAEFDKYKAFPEFQRTNRHMTLAEFKPIYWMEWIHRQWGRAIGLAFALPFAGFAAAGAIPPPLWPGLGGLFALGAAQGGIGWWMVKSGLEHERFSEYDIPRVSPYRLATHVSGAVSAEVGGIGGAV
jgi:heme a synthase